MVVGRRGGIRTRDLRLRRPTLYPAELPAHIRKSNGHIYTKFSSKFHPHFYTDGLNLITPYKPTAIR